jgi:hypothetical protein
MKAQLPLLLVMLLLASVPARAQLLAGEVPDGGNAIELDATITLTQAFTADSIALEFDCDDFQDAWAVLYRGAPEVDGPNSALIRFLDDDVEVCTSLSPPSERRPKYHAFGEALDCAGDFDWQISNELVLGDFGGFFATGPVSIDSLYVGFRRDEQTGWMLLSFDLQGGPAVSLTTHRLLPICPGPTSVDEATTTSGITLYPNPGNGEHIRVETAVVLRSLEVLDATGRMMALYDGTLRTIPSPSDPGTYLVHATQGDGQRSTKRWVRY